MTNETTTTTETTTATDKRIELLAKHLGIEPSEVTISSYDSDTLEAEGAEYLVLDDTDADARTKENILDSLWAFRAEFIASWVDHEDTESFCKSLRTIQGDQCESANPVIKAMLGNNLDAFIRDAILSDGRGHFLSSYDSEEIELGSDYYAYRTN